MKLPKQSLITLGTAVPMLLIGLILASHQMPIAKPQSVSFNKASITTDADPAPSDPTPTDPSSSDPAASTDPWPAPAAPVDAAPSESDPTPPVDPPAPAVATDATITDWSDPVATDSRFSNGGTPLPTVVTYRYCIWTYSDGSTQQQVYAAKYATISGGMSMFDDPTYDCSVANAP